MGLIGSIVLGCLAGFCAGKLMKGGGLGFIMNLVLGLFGGLVGGWLFEQLGITWGGILGQLGTAIIGAVAILWVASYDNLENFYAWADKETNTILTDIT